MISRPNKLTLAALPTPIVKLERLSEASGKNIWLKRDDMTGMEWSGNKIRKLEYIFSEIMEEKNDWVITCGGKQSNHCRSVAAVAAKYGIKCMLYLLGQEEGDCQGNLLMDKLLGAEVRYVSEEEWKDIDKIMENASKELSNKGSKPYVVPLGGSTALGAWGYIDAFEEIAEYEKASSVHFDVISMAVGSVGTLAGIVAGDSMRGNKHKIAGISVLSNKEYVSEKLKELCGEMDISFQTEAVDITDDYIAPGYGKASAKVIDFIKNTAQKEGVLLDPVYSGKALCGLVSELEKGKYKSAENILFLHTGGIFGIFGQADAFI